MLNLKQFGSLKTVCRKKFPAIRLKRYPGHRGPKTENTEHGLDMGFTDRFWINQNKEF
jgi:hypothetical protein